MADLPDVENALVSTIATALYPSGASPGQPSAAGPVCKIYRGWPIPTATGLDPDLAAGIVNISVFTESGGEKNTTRCQTDWQMMTPAAPQITLAVAAQTPNVSVGNLNTHGNAGFASVSTGVAAPDGTFTANVLTEDTNNSVHFLYGLSGNGITTVIAGAPWTEAIFLQAGTRRFVSFGWSDSASSYAFSTIDTVNWTQTTGTTIGGSTPVVTNCSLVPLGGGWYLASVSGFMPGVTMYQSFLGGAITNNSNPTSSYLGTSATIVAFSPTKSMRYPIVTVGGTIQAGDFAAVKIGLHDYFSVASTGSTSAVATALATAIAVKYPGASAFGSVITIPTSATVLVAAGGLGTAWKELRRQSQLFQITAWCPTPTSRDLVGPFIKNIFAGVERIALADNSWGGIRYQRSIVTDKNQTQQSYRRDFFYSVEFPTSITAQFPSIGVFAVNTTGGVSPADTPAAVVTVA